MLRVSLVVNGLVVTPDHEPRFHPLRSIAAPSFKGFIHSFPGGFGQGPTEGITQVVRRNSQGSCSDDDFLCVFFSGFYPPSLKLTFLAPENEGKACLPTIRFQG